MRAGTVSPHVVHTFLRETPSAVCMVRYGSMISTWLLLHLHGGRGDSIGAGLKFASVRPHAAYTRKKTKDLGVIVKSMLGEKARQGINL